MMHPRYEAIKVYIATVEGYPSENALNKLINGVVIDGYKTAPALVKVLEKYKDKTKLEITIHEGRNRQVRKMCESVGHPVIRLKRIAYAGLTLGDLKSGTWRYITETERKQLIEKMCNHESESN